MTASEIKGKLWIRMWPWDLQGINCDCSHSCVWMRSPSESEKRKPERRDHWKIHLWYK